MIEPEKHSAVYGMELDLEYKSFLPEGVCFGVPAELSPDGVCDGRSKFSS